MCGGPGAAGQVPHTCLLASVGLGKCSTGVDTARPGLVHHRQRRQRRAPAGGSGEAVRHGCVAGRAQLGRCRTLACWHQWGWASAAQGWTQPGLACCTTGSGGSDEPRPAAAARRCGTGVWRAGRSWAGAAQLLADISGAGQVQHRGGHSPAWPAAPPAAAAATSPGRPAAAARRCGTGVWRAGRSWAGAAHLLAGISGAGQVQHRGGHSPVWPAAPPAAAASTSPGRRQRRGGAARVCGGPGAAGQVPHTCLLASVGLGKCSTGVDTARPGLLYHRQRRQRRAPAGGGGGEAVRHGCVACRAHCTTVLCYTCLYSEKETQGPARLRPGKKGGREGRSRC